MTLGRIVNLVSILCRFSAPYIAHYSMSKYSTLAFSDAVRRENKNFGVKVSTVEPFAYNTAMAAIENFFFAIPKNNGMKALKKSKIFTAKNFIRIIKI